MRGDLQTAELVTLPSGNLDGHMLLILTIMVATGILGGAANYFLADRQGDAARHDWIKYPVFGVVAALTVPLFLNMISSTLLEGARTRPVDFYVFAGFCLLYVIASRRLFENMVQRLMGQIDLVRRDVGQLKQKRDDVPVAAARSEPELPSAPPRPAAAEAGVRETAREVPRESLSYNDVEILRALTEESVVYGNLAALCERTGLPREFVSQRLTVMKSLGILDTRINDKNILHWSVSARGKAVLDEAVSCQDDKKTA